MREDYYFLFQVWGRGGGAGGGGGGGKAKCILLSNLR